jgi:hypothetical protein
VEAARTNELNKDYVKQKKTPARHTTRHDTKRQAARCGSAGRNMQCFEFRVRIASAPYVVHPCSSAPATATRPQPVTSEPGGPRRRTSKTQSSDPHIRIEAAKMELRTQNIEQRLPRPPPHVPLAIGTALRAHAKQKYEWIMTSRGPRWCCVDFEV